MTTKLLILALFGVAACAGSQTPPDGSSAAGDSDGASSAAAAGDDGGAAASSSGGATGAGGAPDASSSSASGGAQVPQTLAAMVAAGNADSGAKLYEENHCKGCHGTPEKPGKKFPNVFKVEWTDKKLEEAFAIVKKGKSPMPGFGDKLDDKAIADLVAYFQHKK